MVETQKKRRPITNGYPDDTCLAENASPFRKLCFRVGLHTGTYGFYGAEWYGFLVFTTVFSILATINIYSFSRGFWDGIMSVQSTATTTMTTIQECIADECPSVN